MKNQKLIFYSTLTLVNVDGLIYNFIFKVGAIFRWKEIDQEPNRGKTDVFC